MADTANRNLRYPKVRKLKKDWRAETAEFIRDQRLGPKKGQDP
jgi:hypothetical protein